MSIAGFCFTTDVYDEGTLPQAAGAMDVGGLALALQCTHALLRVYFKGNPTVGQVAAKILELDKQVAHSTTLKHVYYQIGNEPNLEMEGWQGGLRTYLLFFAQLRSLLPSSIKLAWAGMSPGVPGWEAWYEDIPDNADAVVAHVYGQDLHTLLSTLRIITDRVQQHLPIIIGESNFGPGPGVEVDLNAWATDAWIPFLNAVDAIPQILFTLYFAYTWNSDMQLATRPDAKGTKIVPVTLSWTPPATEPVPLPPLPDPPFIPPPLPPISKLEPYGRAWWVWYIKNCGGVEGIIDACRKTAVRDVFIKGGDGPYVWDQLTPTVVQQLNDAGINVYAWHYTYLGWLPGTIHGDNNKWSVQDEVACVKGMLDLAGPNIAGFISDPEAETEGRASAAEIYVASVYNMLGGKFFGYAPLPVIDYHQELPYVQFNGLCDAVMPQFYSRNLQGDPPWTQARIIEQWDRWRATWAAANLPVPTMMPAGETYGLATTGSVLEFEQLAVQHEWPSWSYWSLEHAMQNRLLDVVASIAADAPPPTPPPTPVPTPGETPVIQLSDHDKARVIAIFEDMWSDSESLHAILAKPEYGQAGQRTGYWAEMALKGNQDLVKELVGLNPNV